MLAAAAWYVTWRVHRWVLRKVVATFLREAAPESGRGK